MIGQLDIFSAVPAREPEAPAPVEPPRAEIPQTCDECGSTTDVLYGCCRPCFDAWRAAA